MKPTYQTWHSSVLAAAITLCDGEENFQSLVADGDDFIEFQILDAWVKAADVSITGISFDGSDPALEELSPKRDCVWMIASDDDKGVDNARMEVFWDRRIVVFQGFQDEDNSVPDLIFQYVPNPKLEDQYAQRAEIASANDEG